MHKCFCVYILVQISENMLVIHILSIVACFVSHYKFCIKSHTSIVSKPLANPNHKDIASVGPDIPISGPNTFSGSGQRARTRSIVQVRTRWIDYILYSGVLIFSLFLHPAPFQVSSRPVPRFPRRCKGWWSAFLFWYYTILLEKVCKRCNPPATFIVVARYMSMYSLHSP